MTIRREIDSPLASLIGGDFVEVELELDTPIEVPRLHYLYAAVEMVGDPETDTGYTCVAACRSFGESNRSWWGAPAEAPTTWTTLQDLGVSGKPGMRADGIYE